ncbi:hypothetical protein [Streptomyces sp. 1331.2]|uniref:hypothetical protein n=1 Tax=Streptomyces sp. 1331.2 TaxID=1938835 RepID=UPI000EB44A1B|nr:hypothetical protein [Streptomyces sp. 1331.2]
MASATRRCRWRTVTLVECSYPRVTATPVECSYPRVTATLVEAFAPPTPGIWMPASALTVTVAEALKVSVLVFEMPVVMVSPTFWFSEMTLSAQATSEWARQDSMV